MSEKSARAQRYAQAIFEAMLERWQSALNQAANVMSQDKPLHAALMDSSQTFADRAAAMQSALPADLPPEVSNLLRLLLQEGDLELLPEISTALAQVASGKAAPLKGEITSAAELTEGDKAALRNTLVQQHGDDLVLSFQVDPSLMGGLRVRVGDRLIDASVASRLAALRESLASVVR